MSLGSRVLRSPLIRRALLALGLLALFVAVTFGGYWAWYTHRTPPPAIAASPLFSGATYARVVVAAPRPCVFHVVELDLRTPGLEWVVTSPSPRDGRELPARRTSAFLEEQHLTLAVNAGFFDPFWSNGPIDYYPHAGDPVDVLGFSASRGAIYGRPAPGEVTLAISEAGEVSIGAAPTPVWNALSGYLLLEDGVPRRPRMAATDEPHPRTAIAIDRAKARMWIVVTDGRQPGYSDGATTDELARFLADRGGDRAVLLDGGGSSSLVVDDGTGHARHLNLPVHGRHPPGRERPVANHLGLRVKGGA